MPGPAGVGVGGLLIRGAGIALRGVGKALKASRTAAKTKKRPKRKKRRGGNDDLALPILLGTTGAAGIGLSAKQGFDKLKKRKKNRTGGR
mgnify:CR=1 FL=1|jgi:hypothetical protein|tara:strand:+ start:414 stop:683 length:270 start_codon:yes stop_codon:yes gene_type:complete